MTLFSYVFWRYTLVFLRSFLVFGAILFIVGMVDEIGRLQGDEGLLRAAYLSALGQSEALYTIMPLIAIIAAIVLFLGMSRSSEIVAARASGVSGLRFLLGPSFAALILGIVTIALLNPLVTALSNRFAAEKGRPAENAVVFLDSVGLWLRQGSAEGQIMIHAATVSPDDLLLSGVMFIGLDALGKPIWRIDAEMARLQPGAWHLSGAYRWDLTLDNPQQQRSPLQKDHELATDLTANDLLSGFGKPTSVSIWSLPGQITTMEKAGFSARAYRVWLQSELAKPLTFVAMVLVAAGFTMRHIRASGRAQLVLYAVLLGFGIFFLRNIAQVFGQNGQLPVLLAAWGPTLAATLLAISLLLHLEEG